MTTLAYDAHNVFAKIIRKEIPCKAILETDHTLSFHDITPKAPVHALVIPKGAYQNAFDFHQQALADEILDFYKTVNDTIQALHLTEMGFRLVSNTGVHGRQEVLHYHMHILGGGALKSVLN